MQKDAKSNELKYPNTEIHFLKDESKPSGFNPSLSFKEEKISDVKILFDLVEVS
jgi:hypothetical protein